MKDRSRNILVGFTALIGLGGAAVMLVLFGYLPIWLDKGYDIKIAFDSASGLSVNSRVKLSGIEIGRITRIDFPDKRGPGVIVTAIIKKDIFLPHGVRARVEQPLLGGSPTLQLDTTDVTAVDWSRELDPSIPLRGEIPTVVSDLARQLKEVLREPMDEFRNAKGELTKVREKFEALSDEWTKVGKNLNTLMEPRDVAAVDQGKGEPNLSTVVQRVDARLKQIDEVLQGMQAYVNDEELRKNVKTAAANTARVTEDLKTGVEKFNKLADGTGENLDKLTKRYIALADDASREIATAGKLLEAARNGDGTVGKLVKDPALYNNLNDTVNRINAAMAELKLMIEKWTKEGVPVQF